MAHVHDNLIQQAETLVKERILGTRKGLPDQPTHLHSFRVSAILRNNGFDEDVCLAGLLHDVIEDGGVTVRDLQDNKFPGRVIELVLLCTHDNSMQNKDLRWILMIANLAKANSRDAWAIKLADVFDNFLDSHALSKHRADFMRDVKIPTLLKASEQQLAWSKLWADLNGVHVQTIESTSAIQKSIDYICNEVSSVLKLSEEAKNAVLSACKHVSDTNYGINNSVLFEAIETLHDVMETLSNDDSSGDSRAGLSILGNGLCGDMLVLLKQQKDLVDDLRSRLEMSQNEQSKDT